MDFNIKKGLFSTKKDTENNNAKPSDFETFSSQNTALDEKQTYQQYGFLQASKLGGTLSGLNVCLQKVYADYQEKVKADDALQENLKRPHREKLEELKKEIDLSDKQIEKIKTESIPAEKQKIEKLNAEISHIRRNPQEIINTDTDKASLVVGGIILLFLTLYLFIFYSSATYSAFFKNFLAEDSIFAAIFDANALSAALDDGATELALILTIPFVFLGLGFLIHKFQELKGKDRYWKVAALMGITFLFDTIIAYEITEKIYNIKAGGSFETMPEYTLSMAFSSAQFWLIIFAGFVVYVIWGFVFSFVMEEFNKTSKVRRAIHEKERNIKRIEREIHEWEKKIQKIETTIDANKVKIKGIEKKLASILIPKNFKQDIFSFATGWMAWMKGADRLADLDKAKTAADDFLKNYFTTDNDNE